MIYYYAASNAGKKREKNEDSFFIKDVTTDTNGSTLINKLDASVCDGMGGEEYGELASAKVVEVLAKMCQEKKGIEGLNEAYIDEMCQKANLEVCELMSQMNAKMGSTLTLLRVYRKKAVIANIGDSKVYRLREAELEQMSYDHSTIGGLVRDGIISKEAAKTHPSAHEITQYLGIYPDEMIIEPFITTEDISRGDIYLLCSDGLTDMIEEKEIEKILASSAKLKDKGNTLMSQALENGGVDNVTIALVQIK